MQTPRYTAGSIVPTEFSQQRRARMRARRMTLLARLFWIALAVATVGYIIIPGMIYVVRTEVSQRR